MLPAFAHRLRNRLRRRLWETSLSAVPTAFRASAQRDETIADELTAYEKAAGLNHCAGSLPVRTLLRIESLLQGADASIETGCGKSTIFFSRIFARHRTFCLDDRNDATNSSVAYFMDCPATRLDRLETVFGPTQQTLPAYAPHAAYDLALIDGPHGFPFPELEYYYLYPHLKPGALLVVDDVNIATIGRLADFIAEDAMFDFLEVVDSTAIFRRTDAPTFDPLGDGWWAQNFNRRRADFNRDVYLRDEKRRKPFDFEGRF